MNKKTIKMVVFSMLTCVFVMCMTFTSVAIEEDICGDDLQWSVNEDGTILTISGASEMFDYSNDDRPWESYEDDIEEIIIEKEVKSIGDFAFYDFDNLEVVTIGGAVESIGEGAFSNCENITVIYIPASVVLIEAMAFENCVLLSTVYYAGSEDSYSEIQIDSNNDSITQAELICSHSHVDTDKDSRCDECQVEIEKEAWSLISFIKSLYEIVKGYASGLVALFSSLYGE